MPPLRSVKAAWSLVLRRGATRGPILGLLGGNWTGLGVTGATGAGFAAGGMLCKPLAPRCCIMLVNVQMVVIKDLGLESVAGETINTSPVWKGAWLTGTAKL